MQLMLLKFDFFIDLRFFYSFHQAMDFLFIFSCRLTLTWRVQVTLGFSQTYREMVGKHRAGSCPHQWSSNTSAGRSFAPGVSAHIKPRLCSLNLVVLGEDEHCQCVLQM